MHSAKTSTFVHVCAFKRFELVVIISLNFPPKVMWAPFGSFSSLVIYLLWILMFGVHVMSRSLSAWLFIIALVLSNYHRKRGGGTFLRLCWNNKLAVLLPLPLSQCNRRSRPAHCRPRHGHGQCGSRRHNTSYKTKEQVLRLWQDLQALEVAEEKKW